MPVSLQYGPSGRRALDGGNDHFGSAFDDLFDDMVEEVEDHFEKDELGTVLGDPRLRQRVYDPDED